MADATEYLSLADLKTYLQITTTDAARDALLTAIKTAVEKRISNLVRHDLLAATYTEYYDGDGSDTLLLEHYPVITLTSIHDDTDRAFGSSTAKTAYEIADARNYEKGILELYDEVFDDGQKNIKVVYKAGYATIPADLAHAVKVICQQEYLLYDKKLGGQTVRSVGDMSITLSQEDVRIPRNAWEMLKPYMREPRL